MKLLSIHVPTIEGREEVFEKLKQKITNQIQGRSDIELLVLKDNKEISIGKKRQKLIDMTTAKYIVQIDDDDDIADDYILTVLPYLTTNIDCIGYLEHITPEGSGGRHKTACHSNRFQDWATNKEGFDFVRTPFFKDIIRTDIVRAIGVDDLRFGEDYSFSKKLKNSKLITTEVFIEKYMYFYKMPLFNNNNQRTKRYGITK